MDYRGFANNFNEYIATLLKDTVKDLHGLYDTRCDLIEAINENGEYYSIYGIRWEKVNDIDNLQGISISRNNVMKGGEIIDYVKASYIKAYNKVNKKIKKAQHDIKIYTLIVDIEEETYKQAIRHLNLEFMNHCIKGGRSYIGSALGSIYVAMTKYNPNKFYVDWRSSYELRKQLLSEGKQPKDAFHKDGYPWIVFFEPNNLPVFRWAKFNINVENKEYYRFNAWHIASSKSAEELDVSSKASILKNPAHSPIRRLFAMFNNFKDVVNEYWRNTSYNNWDSDLYSKEYVDRYRANKKDTYD